MPGHRVTEGRRARAQVLRAHALGRRAGRRVPVSAHTRGPRSSRRNPGGLGAPLTRPRSPKAGAKAPGDTEAGR